MTDFYNKSWKAGEALSPLKLNRYISGNYEFLRYRNRSNGSSASDYVLGATIAAVDDSKFNLTYSVRESEDVLLTIRWAALATSIASYMRWDILIDDSYYLSSGTPTPSTQHLGRLSVPVINVPFMQSYRRKISDLSTGSHTFSLRAMRNGAVTISGTNYPTRFEVEGY